MRDTRRADELATYWRRGKAIHLAAVTGQPVAAWDRALDAWHVCQWDVELLAEEVQAGHELDPVRIAELAEASMAHAGGRRPHGRGLARVATR